MINEKRIEEAADELGVLLNCRWLMARMGGEVSRYHTWHLNVEQSVADHTWHVMRIYVALFGLPSRNVLLAMLFHDAGEMLGGDMQYPFKLFVPEVKEACDAAEMMMLRRMEMDAPSAVLTDVEKVRMKACDLLEMYEKGTRECMNGNVHTGRAVRARIWRGLTAHLTKMDHQDHNAVVRHLKVVNRWLSHDPELDLDAVEYRKLDGEEERQREQLHTSQR